MAFDGQMKFLEPSMALLKNGATATASSNTAAAKYMLTMNRYIGWTSSGSDDTTTETITITLPSAKTVSSLFLLGINFKEFTVKKQGAADFTNVTGISGELAGGIAETAFTGKAAYYEFDATSVTEIVITATKTQTADEEKACVAVLPTAAIGTFVGFPDLSEGIVLDRNEQRSQAITGRSVISKLVETASLRLRMRSYPEQGDIELVEKLFDRDIPFLVYPCGGNVSHFKVSQKGWRIGDVYQMQTRGNMPSGFKDNIYVLGAEKDIRMEEVV